MEGSGGETKEMQYPLVSLLSLDLSPGQETKNTHTEIPGEPFILIRHEAGEECSNNRKGNQQCQAQG